MKTIALALMLALGQNDAGVPDVPVARVIVRADGSAVFDAAAYKALDLELKRLQTVERQKKIEATNLGWTVAMAFILGMATTLAAYQIARAGAESAEANPSNPSR